MADSGKFELRGVHSANSDYSPPKKDTGLVQLTMTSTLCKHGEILAPTAAAVTIYDHTVEGWTSLEALFVRVIGATAVTVTYDDSSDVARTHVIATGMAFFIGGLGADSITLQAATGDSEVEFMIMGTA